MMVFVPRQQSSNLVSESDTVGFEIYRPRQGHVRLARYL